MGVLRWACLRGDDLDMTAAGHPAARLLGYGSVRSGPRAASDGDPLRWRSILEGREHLRSRPITGLGIMSDAYPPRVPRVSPNVNTEHHRGRRVIAVKSKFVCNSARLGVAIRRSPSTARRGQTPAPPNRSPDSHNAVRCPIPHAVPSAPLPPAVPPRPGAGRFG